MTGYSFNRVRTAALKSLSAMTSRLQNICGDFADVDMYLVGKAEEVIGAIGEFEEALRLAEDPLDGRRELSGYTLAKVRTVPVGGRRKPAKPQAASDDLFDRFRGQP